MSPRRVICDAERASIAERFEERGGTLDGVPAFVVGRDKPFALVVQQYARWNASQARAEFAWETLDRISRQDAPAARS